METKLIYLEDTYLFESNAKVLRIEEFEDKKAIILDETIFYPQGGGQPSDVGEITSSEMNFVVEKVKLNPETSEVYHIGYFESGNFSIGDNVILKINRDKRILHAKLHTAGHLVDMAVYSLGLPLKPTKGYHFADSPYVEYEGELDDFFEKDVLIRDLNSELEKLISQNIEIIAKNLSDDELEELDISSPKGKSPRFVYFEGSFDKGCGCGGTHVLKTSELGKVEITKIKPKRGNFRIGYKIS